MYSLEWFNRALLGISKEFPIDAGSFYWACEAFPFNQDTFGPNPKQRQIRIFYWSICAEPPEEYKQLIKELEAWVKDKPRVSAIQFLRFYLGQTFADFDEESWRSVEKALGEVSASRGNNAKLSPSGVAKHFAAEYDGTRQKSQELIEYFFNIWDSWENLKDIRQARESKAPQSLPGFGGIDAIQHRSWLLYGEER